MKAVLHVRDADGNAWSVGALLTDEAVRYPDGEPNEVWVPVEQVLRNGHLTGIVVVDETPPQAVL